MPYTTLENLLRPSIPHDDAAILAHVIEIPLDTIDHDSKPALKMLVVNCYSLSQMYIDNLLTSALLGALINRTNPNLVFINGLEELSSALNKNIADSLCNFDKKWSFTSKDKTVLCFPLDTIQPFEAIDLYETSHYDFFIVAQASLKRKDKTYMSIFLLINQRNMYYLIRWSIMCI